MRSKILWIDCETTGTQPDIHDIWSLAYIIDIDGNVEYEDHIKIRPYNFETISAEALKVGGTTVEELEKFDTDVAKAVRHLKRTWGIYIDKYDREDKFVIGGYNVRFDQNFLYEMFKKAGDRYGLGSWAFWPLLDASTWVGQHIAKFKLRLHNYKLSTVCEHYGIELKAHDAIEDVRAARELYYLLEGMV